MALPPLNAPPIRTPLTGRDGLVSPAWAAWFDILWRKTGEATMVAPITAVAAQTVPPISVSGNPEGAVAAPAGTWAQDPATGDLYFKTAGEEETGWEIA